MMRRDISDLCLSTSYADCIITRAMRKAFWKPLPQHVLRGLHHFVESAQRNPGPLPQHVLRGLHLKAALRELVRRAFASARPTRIASINYMMQMLDDRTLPQHVLRGLHLSCSIGNINMICFASARPTRIASPFVLPFTATVSTLPQHVLRGLHRQKRTR